MFGRDALLRHARPAPSAAPAPAPTPAPATTANGRVPRSRRRMLPRLTAAGVLLTLTLGCSSGDDPSEREGTDSSSRPDADGSAAAPGSVDPELWVDPETPAARQVAEWEATGRADDAEALRLLADQPIAEWPPAEGGHGPRIAEVAEAAQREGQTAVFVAYNVPHRDCGQYSQGGASDIAAYGEWLDTFAENIRDAEAIVILEPDAVPHIVDGCTAGMYHEERYEVLSKAVARFKELPNTRVYIDAGNPSWITEPEKLTEPLWRSGFAEADGFALNVSNYQKTEDVLAYGRELSALLDDAHFVIDTSRNGNGPLDSDQDEAWCNPPGRGLGQPPTTETGDPLVDAFLWIKRPGESDGECRGGPRAGDWWPEYALGLAREAEG